MRTYLIAGHLPLAIQVEVTMFLHGALPLAGLRQGPSEEKEEIR